MRVLVFYRIPRPFRIFLWVIFLGVAIESLIHTTQVFHSIMTTRSDVHTRSTSR